MEVVGLGELPNAGNIQHTLYLTSTASVAVELQHAILSAKQLAQVLMQ